MIRFESDYTEGAHPEIIRLLVDTNDEQSAGYGEDGHSEKAREYIKKHCGRNDIDIHFLVGGTQANATVISAVLKSHQGVIAAVSGHINTHESGAIEATGHKILAVASTDGKITPGDISSVYEEHWSDPTHEHMVQPGMVYISQPTENGTIYTKSELTALHAACSKCQLPLYIDGARLGYSLMAPDNDLSLPEIAGLCDIFYIGGTKVGALFGEAVVIINNDIKRDFRYHIKQRGGLLAKGRLLGIQFEALFKDSLYFEIAGNATRMAMMIRDAFIASGFKFLYDSTSNQQFPILNNSDIEQLEKKYSFHKWAMIDDTHSCTFLYQLGYQKRAG